MLLIRKYLFHLLTLPFTSYMGRSLPHGAAVRIKCYKSQCLGLYFLLLGNKGNK